jgi:hypothetical protein
MTRVRTILATGALVLAMSSAPALAQDWHHGGAWHGGEWHGGGWRGGGWHGGAGWGFGIYGAVPYYPGPYAYYDPYAVPPPVVAAPSWYCPTSNAYYPAVQSCAAPWQQVPAQ